MSAMPRIRHDHSLSLPGVLGEGRVRSRRTLTIKVPPGVDTGTRIQLRGEGEVGPRGNSVGDLFVEVVWPSSSAETSCTA